MDWRVRGWLLLGCCVLTCATSTVRVFVPVRDERVVWIGSGRFEWGTGQGGLPVVVADWPCASFNASLRAAPGARIVGVGVVMEGGHNDFLVFYNDRPVAAGRRGGKLLTDDQLREYGLPRPNGADISDGYLNVSLVKATEASYFALQALLPLSRMRLYGFAVYIDNATAATSELLIMPSAAQDRAVARRRIEFFSDSDSNGFGIEGADSWTCLMGLETYENCWEGYAATVSRWLGADYHIEAWSGKGVVKNAISLFDTSEDPMPLYWPRTIATDPASHWNFTLWVPDLVVILLGTNDYYAWPYPSDEQFVGGYVRMVETVLAAYNSTTASGAPLTVIALCGGTTENDRAPCPRVQQAVKRLLASPDKNVARARIVYVEIPTTLLAYPEDYGCLDHRNVVGQRKLASYLLGQVRPIMNW